MIYGSELLADLTLGAVSTFSVFFDTMNWWSQLFKGQQGNMTDFLNQIVDDFPVQVPLLPSASTILADLGGVLGIVGSLAAINPVGPAFSINPDLFSAN